MTALSLLSSMVMEDSRQWGDVATDWQWSDARAFLDGDLRFHFWLRARGMSKTADAAALLLALVICEAPERSRSYAYAADGEQAGLLLDSITDYVERTGLGDLVDIASRSVTCRASGATLSIESSDAASSFGTRPYCVVLDEVAQWPDVARYSLLWASVISAMGKVRGSRLLVMTSAGSPAHPSFKWWQSAEQSQHWRTILQAGPCPWWTEADIEAATEQLTPAEARRYLHCEWTEADDALATLDDVAACTGAYTVRDPLRRVQYVMSVDVGTRRDSTVVAVGHLEATADGRRVIIDRVQRWTGTRINPVSLSDVETAILANWKTYGSPKLVFDFHQAAQLTERLKGAGVTCEEYVFSVAGVNKLARTLYGCLRDRAILLPDDPDLAAELSTVRLVETGPGLIRLDHRSGQHDDQAVACGLVAAALLDGSSAGPIRLMVASREQRLRSGIPLAPPRTPTMRLGRFTITDPSRYRPPGRAR